MGSTLRGVSPARAALFLALCGSSFAQDANTLLLHVNEALGWAGKTDTVRSLEIHGSYDDSPMILWAQRPSLFRIEITRPHSTVIQSYDGSFGYRKITGRNATASQLKGTDLRKIVDQGTNALGGPLVMAAERGSRVTLEQPATFNGKRYLRLRVTLLSGTSILEWINADNFLPEREQIARRDPGAALITQTLSDYRNFGGILFPCLLSTTTDGTSGQRTMRIDQVVLNPELNTSIFTLH